MTPDCAECQGACCEYILLGFDDWEDMLKGSYQFKGDAK